MIEDAVMILDMRIGIDEGVFLLGRRESATPVRNGLIGHRAAPPCCLPEMASVSFCETISGDPPLRDIGRPVLAKNEHRKPACQFLRSILPEIITGAAISPAFGGKCLV
jgi:hypothetical protein